MTSHTIRIATVATFGLLALPGTLQADTVVTTYVTKVQEERQTTRWTLTEWLRIKERMKMMDVWLAMFSDPAKDQFRPELNLTYGMTRGEVKLKDGGTATESTGDVSGTQGRAELWLTNLISGTVGIRTLNIDLGAEMYQRTTGGLTTVAAAADGTSTEITDDGRALQHSYYTGNLRLFGKNIQDSSLILKYGEYASDNNMPQWSDVDTEGSHKGKVAGAALQVYVLKWLGAEANYLAYGDAKNPQGSDAVKGSYYDYQGFIEISLLRLMVGRYQEDWRFGSATGEKEVAESGLMFGGKLSF